MSWPKKIPLQVIGAVRYAHNDMEIFSVVPHGIRITTPTELGISSVAPQTPRPHYVCGRLPGKRRQPRPRSPGPIDPEQRKITAGPSTAGILGGIIGVVLLLLIVGSVIVLVRKRKQNAENGDGPPKHKPPPPVKTGSSTEMVSGPRPCHSGLIITEGHKPHGVQFVMGLMAIDRRRVAQLSDFDLSTTPQLNKHVMDPVTKKLTEIQPLSKVYYETSGEPVTDLDAYDDNTIGGGAANGGGPAVLEDSIQYADIDETLNDEALPPYSGADGHHVDEPPSATVARGESFVSAAMYV
ncbi:unnamed protein product [Coregonus sp. 'balchen']|nr:unnamed protein product [Coregonus sp. 'balchen']